MRQRTFIAIVLSIVLGGYAALIGVGVSPFYCKHSTSLTDTAPCYKGEVQGHRAETLLVGDSSLLYGVRPDLIAAAGGGSVYNFGMVGPSFSYDPAALIDLYMAKNARPKRIILYFAAHDAITHDRLIDPQWAPLAVLLLQQRDVGGLMHLVSLRPSILAEVPALILGNLGLRTSEASARKKAMLESRGFFDYAARGTPPLDRCKVGSLPPPPYPPAADNRAAIATLKARYAKQGIRLFVLIAPWAVCDNHEAEIEAAYAGVADVRPRALPNRLFAADTPYSNHVHASREGVAVFSERVASFIQAVAGR